MPWPAPPFALACPDSKAKCAALSDRCNEPETETAEVLSSMLLGCLARPCTYLDVGCNLGSVAGLAAAHGATAECFETYPLWVSAVRLHGLAQRLRLAPEGASQRVIDEKGAGGALDFDATFHACGIAALPAPDSNWRSSSSTSIGGAAALGHPYDRAQPHRGALHPHWTGRLQGAHDGDGHAQLDSAPVPKNDKCGF
jgi:hypothetical protein